MFEEIYINKKEKKRNNITTLLLPLSGKKEKKNKNIHLYIGIVLVTGKSPIYEAWKKLYICIDEVSFYTVVYVYADSYVYDCEYV